MFSVQPDRVYLLVREVQRDSHIIKITVIFIYNAGVWITWLVQFKGIGRWIGSLGRQSYLQGAS